MNLTDLVRLCNYVATTSILVPRILQGREVVVILEGELHLTLILAHALLERIDVNVIGGDSVQLSWGEPDSTLLFVEVLLALNAKLT